MDGLPVVAFKGKGGCGKSTAAKYLVEKGAVRTSFAAPLKAMLATLLRYQDVDEGAIERMLDGDLKEAPSKFLGGRSPRVAMQLLGTEFGRALHPNLWIDVWRERWGKYPDKLGIPIVVDDCRFPNEAEAVRSIGGYVVEVIATDAAPSAAGLVGHASEAQDFDPDITILNDKRGLGALHSAIDEAVKVLRDEVADEQAA